MRFARLADESKHRNIKEMFEIFLKYIIADNNIMTNLQKIIIAGPGILKTELHTLLQTNNIIKPFLSDILYNVSDDIPYIAIKELLLLSSEYITSIDINNNNKIVDDFFNYYINNDEYCAIGYDDCKKECENNNVKSFIVHDKKFDEYEEYINKSGIKCDIIYDKTSKGEQFLKGYSGIVAYLYDKPYSIDFNNINNIDFI